MNAKLLLLTVSLPTLCFSACGPNEDIEKSCTTESRFGISLDITDDEGNAVCDASVVISDGDYSEQLEVLNCQYLGAEERAATYIATIDAPNFATFEEEIIVENEDECHVATTALSIVLTPQQECPGEPNPGIEVFVRGPDNQVFCNASVTAIGAGASENLTLVQAGPQNCRYVGAFGRPGTYEGVVEDSGFFTGTSEDNVVVEENECDVVTETLNLVVTPL